MNSLSDILISLFSSPFDEENFRAYLSYKELAFRIYSANFAIGIYNGFIVAVKEELLLTYSELMKTESFSLNKQLLISEGQEWLFKKYGIFDRWSFETIIRLLYEEFLDSKKLVFPCNEINSINSNGFVTL